MRLPKHLRVPAHTRWDGPMYSHIPVEALEDGKPLFLSGGDYAIPGPDGFMWILSAATGSIRLEREAPDVVL